MSKDTEIILLSKVLNNGLNVTIYDKCKRIAWDRYFVKVCCVVTGTYLEADCATMLTSEQLSSFETKYPGYTVTFKIEKERNFVDEDVKETVLNDLIQQCEEGFDYIGSSRFAENLLNKTAQDFIQEFAVRKEMGLVEQPEDVDEPDDFSACFK